MLLKHFSWGYTVRDVILAQTLPLSCLWCCVSQLVQLFLFGFCLFVLNYHVSMFKPILYTHGTMLSHKYLTWLEKHPTLSQEKTCYLTVISSTTLNSSYSMEENIQTWFTRATYPADPHYYCCICNCPRIQERQVSQGEVTSLMRPVNMER